MAFEQGGISYPSTIDEASSDDDSDDDGGGSTRPGSSVPNNLSGGGGSDDSDDGGSSSTAGGGTSSDPAPGLSGGGGVSDTSDDSTPLDTPDPTPPDSPADAQQDNPFSDDSGGSGGGGSGGGTSSDDSPPVGNTPDSGNLPSQSGDSPSSGQGIGPRGVSGTPTEGETGEPGTFDPSATKTGELEDTGTGQIGEQAQSLEQQVVGKQIGELSDGLRLSGAELRSQDVQVTREGDELQAELSPVGRERVEFIAGRQQEQQGEIAAERELGRPLASDDVSVGSGGQVDVSDDVAREAITPAERADNQPPGRNTDVSPSLTRGTGSGTGQQGDGFSQPVARAEDLLGVDAPGEGSVLPSNPDVSAAVEDRTGLDLPDTAGGFARSEIERRTGADLPTESELLPGQRVDVSARLGSAVGGATDAAPPRPEATGPVLGRAFVVGRSAVTGESTEEAAAEIGESAQAAEETTVDAFSPAVGRSPAGGINAARAALGIGAISGGAFAVDEIGIPDQRERDRGELQPGETDPVEIDTPDRPAGQQGELEAGRTDPAELSVPQQRGTDPGTLRTQQLLGVPEQQERQQQPEDRREIEDTGPELGEPDQPPPSARERQRREDLDPFERTFPTGESAVVDGTGTTTEEAQARREQAQQREASQPTQGETAGQQPATGILGRQAQGQGQSPVPGLGLRQGQGQAQVPGLAQPQVPATGNPNAPGLGQPQTPATGNPNVPETGNPNRPGQGGPPSRGGTRRPPRLPDLPSGGDDDEEERLPFGRAVGEIDTDFRNPLTGDVLQGGSVGSDPRGDGQRLGSQVPGLSGFPGFGE